MASPNDAGVSRGFGPGPHPAIEHSVRTEAPIYDSFREKEAIGRRAEQSQSFRGGDSPEGLAHVEKAKEHMTDIPRYAGTWGTGEDLVTAAQRDDGDQPGNGSGKIDNDSGEDFPHQNPPQAGRAGTSLRSKDSQGGFSQAQVNSLERQGRDYAATQPDYGRGNKDATPDRDRSPAQGNGGVRSA